MVPGSANRLAVLDRTGSSSPSPRPSETKGSAFDLPSVPSVTDSPNSSAPSTPNEDSHGHRRTGTVTIGSEDYFVSALRLRQDTKSAPGTPQSAKRNATFSPRIVFFETWPSQEYDRRGEIATCNRLTPMLAQQIKEELNTFKMVCLRLLKKCCPQQKLTFWTGNGGPRELENLHALFLIIQANGPKAQHLPALLLYSFLIQGNGDMRRVFERVDIFRGVSWSA